MRRTIIIFHAKWRRFQSPLSCRLLLVCLARERKLVVRREASTADDSRHHHTPMAVQKPRSVVPRSTRAGGKQTTLNSWRVLPGEVYKYEGAREHHPRTSPVSLLSAVRGMGRVITPVVLARRWPERARAPQVKREDRPACLLALADAAARTVNTDCSPRRRFFPIRRTQRITAVHGARNSRHLSAAAAAPEAAFV